MTGDEHLAREILGHGAYLGVRPVPGADLGRLAAAPVEELARRLGLGNEFDPASPPPPGTVAFLRRRGARPGDIEDADLAGAACVIHAAAKAAVPVAEFCAEARRLLEPAAGVRVVGGVVRPRSYTGAAMHEFAYAHAVVQQPGPAMPNAFLLPLSKTADWWRKDWMERHTYFLPRYDDAGRMTAEGHALASAAGIPCLMRRTYQSLTQPAAGGAYDFVTYFECADADVATFHAVCASLRDVRRNPEWRFVREGPTWHGRRVATWKAAIGG